MSRARLGVCEPKIHGPRRASRVNLRCGIVSAKTRSRASHRHIFARHHTHTVTPKVTMAALSAVAPVLNKAPVVSTGKAANTNSMMVWQPHGNKCVPAPTAIPGFFSLPDRDGGRHLGAPRRAL